jgi:hypothetical protein
VPSSHDLWSTNQTVARRLDHDDDVGWKHGEIISASDSSTHIEGAAGLRVSELLAQASTGRAHVSCTSHVRWHACPVASMRVLRQAHMHVVRALGSVRCCTRSGQHSPAVTCTAWCVCGMACVGGNGGQQWHQQLHSFLLTAHAVGRYSQRLNRAAVASIGSRDSTVGSLVLEAGNCQRLRQQLPAVVRGIAHARGNSDLSLH